MLHAALYRNGNLMMMKRIVPLALAVFGAAGCSARPQAAVDLPPPCAPDVAARILADGTRTIPPSAPDTLPIPPDRPGGAPQGTYQLTLTVGAEGQVVPGTVRVAGPESAEYTRRLVRWAERLRFGPATAEGCAIAQETTLTLTAG
jgi:hypothetical protein